VCWAVDPEREVGTEHHKENVAPLTALQARVERNVSEHQRRIERVTAQVGRPRTFYLLLGFTAFWISANLLAPSFGRQPLDPPPFSWLQGVVGFAALLMTTTILITQNRQTSHAEQRAQLDLQVNLLAEQKVAKLIALMEELRRDLPTVRDRVDRVAETMKEPVDPDALLSALEQTLEAPPHSTPVGGRRA
jgi:uncharacterized membrane protein